MTTRQAAARLGCAERTVLLWLARGELVGERAGKSWRVETASVDQREPAQRPSARPKPPATAPSQDDREAADAAAAPPQRKRATDAGQGREGDYSFRNLGALRELSELAATVVKAVQSLGDRVPSAASRATLDAAMSAVQLGAAGYHAYAGPDKARLYARAREQVAMAAAALWVLADAAHGEAEGLRLLSTSYERAARGLGGLMRRASKRAQDA